MYRNYIRGQHESLDVDLIDAGSGAIFVKADGLEANAFYDMAIYSDSGRTTPLSVSDWENYTEDERKTASEAETGGTGETIYNQIRIINPTYQTGTIYLTFENLGTYPNGDVQGIDYIEPVDADYAYTTQIGKMTYIVFDSLTADRTVTVTDGGFDERSRFKIVNKDPTFKIIVRDGTELIPYWVEPGQTTEFYDIDATLVWASAGWELVFKDLAFTSSIVLYNSFLRTPDYTKNYKGTISNSGTFSRSTNYVDDSGAGITSDRYWTSYANTIFPFFDDSLSQLNSASTTWRWTSIWEWHDAA